MPRLALFFTPFPKNNAMANQRLASMQILLLFAVCCVCVPLSYASENIQKSEQDNDKVQDIVNPFDSDCYDWRGKSIPCDFKQPYAKILLNKSHPDPRFTDNKDGTVTDNLTKLVWLKSANCFGMLDWQNAILAVKSLDEGACGPASGLMLSDGSIAGDWRLPTMIELCTLIDFNRRDPALPNGHMFSDVPPGYHWSATTIDEHPEMAWIVYFESGTTCYENVKNIAGYVWPVRALKE